MDILSQEVKDAIGQPNSGKMLIVCIGNSLRGDDSAGPYIAEHVTKNSRMIRTIDVGEKPEASITEAEILNPAKVVMIDAADFGGRHGEVRVIPMDAIPMNSISTHTFPLNLIARIIEADIKSPVTFVGIQAKQFEIGTALSDEVKHASDAIVHLINAGEH